MRRTKFINFKLLFISFILFLLFITGRPQAVYLFAQSEESKTDVLDEEKKESAEPAYPTAPLPGQQPPPLTEPLPGQPSPLPQSETSLSNEMYGRIESVSEAQYTPGAEGSEKAIEGVKLEKERISLDLKGVDIIELFRILSQKMGLTIVPTKNVAGRVSIFLNNLTFEDALDVIFISQDLASERKGDIINVMTAAEYERLYGKKYNEKRKFESIKLTYARPSTVFNVLSQIKSDIGKIIVDEGSGTIILIDVPEKLNLMEDTISTLDRAPETQIFDLKYAKPADVKTHLTTAITAGAGELYVDERSAKVAVSDLPEKMKKIKRLVKAFDESTPQVFIEAEILEITLKKEYQRGGISWEKIFAENQVHGLDLKGTFPISPSFTPSPLLSATNLTMTVGTLAKHNYTSTLQLLETFGNTKILSRPRIMAINNQEAKVMVGSREAYVSQSQSQSDVTTVTSESIQFIDVGVKLNVVPTVNKDGFVTMKIKPEVSSVRTTLTTALKSTVPIVETSEAETSVRVKDGTMIMIAGLMKEEKRDDRTGIPALTKIPILGAIFGSRATLNKRTELIIFITPHIVSGETTVFGTEPEKLIPPDIVPKDIQDDIISKKVAEIKVGPQREGLLEAEKAKAAQMPVEKEEVLRDIQEKMKDLKEY